MLRHVPKRIRRDIRNYDRRSAIGRCPARAGTRSNRQLFHLLPPSFGETRPRDRLQMNAIGTKQQNRSERAGTVLFDNLTQDIQDVLERNTGGDHLEKTLFTSEQGLSPLTLADVYRGSGITIDFARRSEGRSAYSLDMLNRSVRKCESEFQVKTSPLMNCFIELLLNKLSIFRMNCLHEQLKRGLGPLRIEAKDPVMLLRRSGLPAGNIPAPAPSVADSLALG